MSNIRGASKYDIIQTKSQVTVSNKININLNLKAISLTPKAIIKNSLASSQFVASSLLNVNVHWNYYSISYNFFSIYVLEWPISGSVL